MPHNKGFLPLQFSIRSMLVFTACAAVVLAAYCVSIYVACFAASIVVAMFFATVLEGQG